MTTTVSVDMRTKPELGDDAAESMATMAACSADAALQAPIDARLSTTADDVPVSLTTLTATSVVMRLCSPRAR